MKIKCAICGTEFESKNVRYKYCSDKCRATATRLREINRPKRTKKRPPRKTSDKTLYELSTEALNAGMSYGKYISKFY